MKRPLLTLGFFAVISAALPAQTPEPPIADTRLTVHTLVREDIFAGFLQNDLARLARAEKNIELLLASRPGDRASLLAWQGSTALTRAVVANDAGLADQFQQHYRRALDLFAEAMRRARKSSLCSPSPAARRRQWPIGCRRQSGRQVGNRPTTPISSCGGCRKQRSKSCRSIIKAKCSRASRRARNAPDATKRSPRTRPHAGAPARDAVRKSRPAMEGRPLYAHAGQADVPDLPCAGDARRTHR